MFKNSGFYFFVLAVSVGYFISAVSLGKPVENSQPGPAFFPIVLGAFSIIVSLILLLRLIKTNQAALLSNSGSSSGSNEEKEQGRLRAYLIILATAVYVFSFVKLGFFPSSIPYIFAVILIFSDFKQMASKLLYSIIIALLGFFIFTQIFNVRLAAFWG